MDHLFTPILVFSAFLLAGTIRRADTARARGIDAIKQALARAVETGRFAPDTADRAT